MPSKKPKKESIKSDPDARATPEVRDAEAAKEPPSIVDGKVGTEGWGPGTITDAIVDETEDAQKKA